MEFYRRARLQWESLKAFLEVIALVISTTHNFKLKDISFDIGVITETLTSWPMITGPTYLKHRVNLLELDYLGNRILGT